MPLPRSGIELSRRPRQPAPINDSNTAASSRAHSRIFGTVSGRVRRLKGFQKHHHVPDSHSDAAQNFVRKAGQPEVKDCADQLYNDIRSLFGYKRREFDYSCEDGTAWIKTPDFDLQIRIDQCAEDPKNYVLTTEVLTLHNETVASDPRFHQCLTHHCDQLIIEFPSPIQVEDKIDRIEDLPELADALTYEPDGSAFELKLPALDLWIEVNESSIRFSLLTLRNLGKLLDHSQKAFDILSDCDFGLSLYESA